MVLKAVFPAVIAAALLAAGAAQAADYRPDEFLGLDLSKAVLSPKPLGPSTTFAPVPVEAKSDARNEARNETGNSVSGVLAQRDAKKVAVEHIDGAPVRTELTSAAHRDGHLARAHGDKPRGAARARLARRHGDPMNAEARDMRVQKWPCNPDMGGICAWQR